MTKLIVNADDFGYSKGINLGIIEAHREGIVSSTTLMTNMPGAEHAFELAKENQQLGVGIHLVLDCGFPVHEHVPSLVDENGRLLKMAQLLERATEEDIEKELTSQIEKFLSFGVKPTHMDSHHHIHSLEKVFPIVRKLAEKYQLPIRKVTRNSITASDYEGLKTVDYFNDEFYGEELDVAGLKEILLQAKNYATVEVMAHPGYVDYEILTGSSYHTPRVKELALLTDPEIKNYLKEHQITLATYQDI